MRNPVLPFPPVCIYFMNPDHYFLSPSTARVTLARILLLGQLASSTKLCHRCLSLITCPTNPLLTWLQIRLPLLSFCLDLCLFLITCKEFMCSCISSFWRWWEVRISLAWHISCLQILLAIGLLVFVIVSPISTCPTWILLASTTTRHISSQASNWLG